jgi:hypothetical protein
MESTVILLEFEGAQDLINQEGQSIDTASAGYLKKMARFYRTHLAPHLKIIRQLTEKRNPVFEENDSETKAETLPNDSPYVEWHHASSLWER